ncbi:lipopolysaccharide biosynthesis protein [Pedobacter hiemivivus]|uniref:Lipopolysaccharide biosynthesis protein n=1 Tax=Pedobacter hiemivivus TaxID=2530454 RepID=A0A4V5PD40_9SPHI|nr:lipopolysaccharide biosynthesis protein [Pedobacter hiemivivus]TKC59276.1 lipopolysaccharide biosynthesis protein [Pedobacter hiemivivus]
MDIKSFLKLVRKYLWIVILVPVIAVTITYFLVQNLPKQYKSEAQISTGLLDPSKRVISDQTVDFFKISQEFNNIMEKFKMKKVMNLLSYNLILHDLELPKKAFRKYSEKIDSLSQQNKNEVIAQIRQKLLNKELLTLEDNKGKYKIFDIIGSMGYGEETLKKTIEITHLDNSDFINIEYVSENPELSAYVVNTLASEFINNYSADVNNNQNVSIILLDSLLKKKEATMNEKNNALSQFKRTKGVLNLGEQSATVYSQITAYEAQKVEALKQIQSSMGAIATIESKLRGSDPYVTGSSVSDNTDIVTLKRQLETANANWVDGGFKSSDQKKVDSLSRLISAKSIRNSNENLLDPRTSKQALVQQKLNLEIAMQQAKSSLKSLDAELAVLRGRYSSMVPYDADIQNYEREADLATKDYMAALDRYNNSRTEQKMGLKLQIEQYGLPGLPEPSKKVIYLALSGLISFLLVLGALAFICMNDKSINSSSQLSSATKSRVLGNLNYLSGSDRNVRNIWNDNDKNKDFSLYRNMLRSLRFEISNEMIKDASNILGVTSIASKAGKTYIAYNLAYAFAMIGKKVLLIGEEPVTTSNEGIKSISTSQNFEAFIVKKEIVTEDLITILNKNATNNSILELQNERSLKVGFDVLKGQFDIIIIDVNSLRDTNIAKEWLSFTEKSIAVFEAGNSIGDQDKEYIEYLKSNPGFMGWVLNKIKLTEAKANQVPA